MSYIWSDEIAGGCFGSAVVQQMRDVGKSMVSRAGRRVPAIRFCMHCAPGRMLAAALAGFAIVAVAIAVGPGMVEAQQAVSHGARAAKTPVSRPVPRFVSLKSDRVNLRQGPSKEHQVTWVFSRAGLPVEVTAEFDNWRRVRDSEGAEGWVYYSLLSGRRTALVVPWDKGKPGAVPLRKDKGSDKVIAQLQPGVLGSVDLCDGDWCRLDVDGYSGWIPQIKLWGVYRGEVLK